MSFLDRFRTPKSYTAQTLHTDFVEEICRALMANNVMDKMRTFNTLNLPLRVDQVTDFGAKCYEAIGKAIYRLQNDATDMSECLLILTELLDQISKLVIFDEKQIKSVRDPLRALIQKICVSVGKDIAKVVNKKQNFLRFNPHALLFRQFELGLSVPNQALTIKDWHRQNLKVNDTPIVVSAALSDRPATLAEWNYCVDTIRNCFLHHGFTPQQANYLTGYLNQDGLESVTKVISAFVLFLHPAIIASQSIDPVTEVSVRTQSVKFINASTIECAATSNFDVNDMDHPNGEGHKTEQAIRFDFKITLCWDHPLDFAPRVKSFDLNLACKPVKFINGPALDTLLRPLTKKANYQELIKQANSKPASRQLLSALEPIGDFRKYIAPPLN